MRRQYTLQGFRKGYKNEILSRLGKEVEDQEKLRPTGRSNKVIYFWPLVPGRLEKNQPKNYPLARPKAMHKFGSQF